VFEYSPGEFVLVEKINIVFTLKDLLMEKIQIDKNNEIEMMRSLAEFSRSIRYFRVIGDFHVGQVAYSGTEWLILDSSPGHITIDSRVNVNRSNPWESESFDFYARNSKKGRVFVEQIHQLLINSLEAQGSCANIFVY
jgi:hypothetical protein